MAEKSNKFLDPLRKFLAIRWMKLGIFLVVFIAIMLLVLGLKGFDQYGALFFFKTILVDNFLRINSLVLGILVLIGYLVLGRGIADAATGALKTMIGVLLLSIGASALVNLAAPIFKGLTQISGSNAKITPLDPYLGWTSSDNFLTYGIGGSFVSWVTFALIVGLIVNIILIALKKWTNVHSLMVTGHVMFQQTSILTAVMYMTAFREIGTGIGSQVGLIIFAGIVMGVYWGVSSTATIKATNIITHNANFAVGHQQMFGAALAYKIGRFYGRPEDSAETKTISKKLKIFEDNIFTQTLIILILFIVLIVIIQTATPLNFEPGIAATGFGSWNVAGGSWWGVNMVLGSLQIIAAILALTAGVRMFVTELQQSFQGIAMKILPEAVVAVDCAATYGFSPNSVTYGFLSGIIAQFAAVGVIIGISIGTKGAFPIVVPLFITLFFNSGTIGVFANASGGWKASLIVPALFGFAELFTAAGAVAMLGYAFDKGAADGVLIAARATSTGALSNSPVATGYIGMADWNLVFALTFTISGLGIPAAFIAFPVLIVLMIILSQFVDSSMRSTPTWAQKMFRLKVALKTMSAESEKKKKEKGAVANA